MKKLSILLAAFILAITTLIAGCGSSVADEFVGTWVIKSGGLYLSIEKQGESTFIINEYYYDQNNKAESFESHKGELKEKVLNADNYSYTIKENKMVSNKNSTYTKVNDKALSKEELQKLAKSK